MKLGLRLGWPAGPAFNHLVQKCYIIIVCQLLFRKLLFCPKGGAFTSSILSPSVGILYQNFHPTVGHLQRFSSKCQMPDKCQMAGGGGGWGGDGQAWNWLGHYHRQKIAVDILRLTCFLILRLAIWRCMLWLVDYLYRPFAKWCTYQFFPQQGECRHILGQLL